jgi:hypothetical protein
VRNTIARQLKRFAPGADFDGVDAHASFLMMAVVVGGALKQKPAAPSAGAAGSYSTAETYFVSWGFIFLGAQPSSKLFNIAHFGGDSTDAVSGRAFREGLQPPRTGTGAVLRWARQRLMRSRAEAERKAGIQAVDRLSINLSPSLAPAAPKS